MFKSKKNGHRRGRRSKYKNALAGPSRTVTAWCGPAIVRDVALLPYQQDTFGEASVRTFVVELGTGTDLHGQDPTKAAVRAVRDAFAHVSLPGLRAVAGVADLATVAVDVTIGAPPQAGRVDESAIRDQFPFGRVSVTVEPGGLMVPGDAFRPEFGDTVDAIVMANAAIFIRVP